MRSSRPSSWLPALGALALAAATLGGRADPAMHLAVAAMAVAACLLAAARAPGPLRRIALVTAGAVGAGAASRAMWMSWPDPSPPPAGALVAGALAVDALLVLGIGVAERVRTGTRRAEDVLDAMVIALAAGALGWQLLAAPSGSSTLVRVVAAAHLAGTAALAGQVVRLGFGRVARAPAWWFLLTSSVALLGGDLVESAATGRARDLASVLWMAGLAGISASVLHPTFEGLATATPAPPERQERMWVLGAAAVAVPVSVGMAGGAVVPLLATTTLVLAVMVRSGLTIRRADSSDDRRLASLVAHGNELVAVVDTEGHLTYVSPAAERQLRITAGHRTVLAWVHPDDRAGLRAVADQVQASPPDTVVTTEVRLHHPERGWAVYLAELTNRLHDPHVRGMIANVHDIDDLRRLASIDALTGAANRVGFGQALAQLLDDGRPLVVVVVDIDGFRDINDTLGHTIGDQILVTVARRLRELAGDGLVGRLGGDEFALAATDEPGLADQLVTRLGEPISLGGSSLTVRVSAGVAHAEDGSGADDLLRRADLALYAAKDAGRDRWVAYRPTLGARARRRTDLRRALSEALDTSGLSVHYQPVFALPTGRVIGLEALSRWDHPTWGPVSPGDFITAAEDTSLIVRLGRWVLDEAIGQLATWQRDRPDDDPLHIAVNVSPRQLLDPGLADDVSERLTRHGVAPERLLLEITEQAALDHAAAGTMLARLRELGVRLAIDDYGSGNASIGYLRQLPIDVLKIDQSLVRSLHDDDGQSRALIRAITELASALRMDTVAEGIETAAQLRAVVALGCRAGQGFLLGRPVAADEAGAALARLVAETGQASWLHPWWEPPAAARPVA